MDLLVIIPIKSPYGIFANVGDTISYKNGMATNRNTSMFVDKNEIKKSTRKITFLSSLLEIIKL